MGRYLRVMGYVAGDGDVTFANGAPVERDARLTVHGMDGPWPRPNVGPEG